MQAIDLTGYKLTFDEEFNDRSISLTGADTRWADVRAEWRGDAYADVGFGRSSFVDPGSGYDPFTVANGALTITASPDITKYGCPGSWESGLINTKASFSQTYGYFEMRADLSDSPGAWDAFWLLPEAPAKTSAPGWQELDIVEHYGVYNQGDYSWIHTTDPSSNPNLDRQVFSNNPATTSGYHTYGMLWGPDVISFYVDGVLKGTRQTPNDMHGPMYILANLAVTSDMPASGPRMSTKIDYIRAFSADPSAVAVAQDAVSPPDGTDPGLYGASTLQPRVTITSQVLAADTGTSATDNVTSNGAVTLTGTVAGQAGTVVRIVDGSSVLGSATLDNSGGWTFTTTLASGTHRLRAVATDLGGYQAASQDAATVTVIANPSLPLLTSTAMVAVGRSVKLAGTVSDMSAAGIAVYSRSTLLGAASVSPQGRWTYASDLAAGSYALTPVATDLAGNTWSLATPLTIAVKSRTNAPSAATVTQSGGDVAFADDMTIQAGATYDFVDDSNLHVGRFVLASGQLGKLGGGGTSTIAGLYNVDAASRVNVASGTLQFSGSGTIGGAVTGSGTLAIAGGAVCLGDQVSLTVAHLAVSGDATRLTVQDLAYDGELSQGAGSVITTATGTTLALAGTASLNGVLRGAGTLAVTSGTTTFGPGALLLVANLSLSGGVTTIASVLTSAATFSASAGATVDLMAGRLVLTGTAHFDGAALAGSTRLRVAGATTVGTLTIGGTAIFMNTGTVVQAGGNVTIGDDSALAATLYNAIGATYALTDDSDIGLGKAIGSYVLNYGLLEKNGGIGVSRIDAKVGNAGTIAVSSGSLEFHRLVWGSGTLAIQGAATLQVDARVTADQTVQFSGAGGTLAIGDPQRFSGQIAGFDATDTLKLTGPFAFKSFVENSQNTQGTLTLSDGSHDASITLLGRYNASSFHSAISQGSAFIGYGL